MAEGADPSFAAFAQHPGPNVKSVSSGGSLAALAGPEAAMAGKIDATASTDMIHGGQLAGIKFYKEAFDVNGEVTKAYEGFLTPVQVKTGFYVAALKKIFMAAAAAMKGGQYDNKDVLKLRMLEAQFGSVSIFKIAEQMAVRAVEIESKRHGLLTVMHTVDDTFKI